MLNALYVAGLIIVAIVFVFLLPGCAVNGVPMRKSPADPAVPLSQRWYIEGKAPNGAPISCSFVEFDERGDFLDFAQHDDCQARLTELAARGRVLLVVYCHGWKNNSQSGDVVDFNTFLGRLASSEEIVRRGLRVHGVYLGWRGNAFRPYIDTTEKNREYAQATASYGESIVAEEYRRRWYWTGVVPETLSYWNRKGAAEHLVSGLPMARAIFTYAATAKAYGRAMDNRVCVLGHSFGALMLEQSLGQAMTGALTLDWWQEEGAAQRRRGLPFDLVLFVNSAAPAIYAKEMRDFLKAYRSGLALAHSPDQDVPVIVSVTSSADLATGVVHPIGNALTPLDPSLQRRYTSGIFAPPRGGYPKHDPVPQSAFYTKTPGHHPYLINHWIVREDDSLLPADTSAAAVFSANLASGGSEPDLFYTSKARHPAAVWRLTRAAPPGAKVQLNGMPPAMADSGYWIVSCGKELIGGHNDVWSPTTMEMYVALFRAAESRRGPQR